MEIPAAIAQRACDAAGVARAGKLLAAGDEKRARDECERMLRLVPQHAGAVAIMTLTTRGGRISRLFRW